MDLTVDQLAKELFDRGSDSNQSFEFWLGFAKLLFKYDVDLSLDNFNDRRGVLLKDLTGRVVTLYPVVSMEGVLRMDREPFSDVLVLCEGTSVLGWVLAQDVKPISESLYVVSAGALNRMPKQFLFTQECPHMSVHGGIWKPGASEWECLGCGKLLAGT
jgi:hypothetical protein